MNYDPQHIGNYSHVIAGEIWRKWANKHSFSYVHGYIEGVMWSRERFWKPMEEVFHEDIKELMAVLTKATEKKFNIDYDNDENYDYLYRVLEDMFDVTDYRSYL